MNKNNLINELNKRAIVCTEKQVESLYDFMNEVLATNKLFNLTAIKDEDVFVEKMIFDSLLLLCNNDFTNQEILDIGCGAGFPSVVLAIASPTSKIYALDSTAKKINFINNYAQRNNLNIETICARAEDYAKNNKERFSFITARAVAPLYILIELAIPMLKIGGYFIAMKGPGLEKEIDEAKGAFKHLNCAIDHIYEDVLPESNESRYLIYIKKVGKNDQKYPRTFAQIKNKKL